MAHELIVIFVVFAGILGCLVGSFLNVCIFRLPRACMSIVRPASRCPRCLKPIRWFDNIPLASYLILGGKCRTCRLPISIRYPLVELLTGLLFLAAAWLMIREGRGELKYESYTWFVVRLYLICVFVVVTFIDLDFRIIPNEITVSGVVIALLASSAFPFLHRGNLPVQEVVSNDHLRGLIAGVFGAMVGGGLIYLVGVFGKLAFRKEAMGFGDVKYMAMLGGFFGWKWVLIVFLLACFLGSVFGIVSWLITRDRYIAFGPFLSGGALLVLLFRSHLQDLLDQYLALLKSAA